MSAYVGRRPNLIKKLLGSKSLKAGCHRWKIPVTPYVEAIDKIYSRRK